MNLRTRIFLDFLVCYIAYRFYVQNQDVILKCLIITK